MLTALALVTIPLFIFLIYREVRKPKKFWWERVFNA